uniref:Uncharacterized protein n=1 Tax=Hyaloperonospora arabidopsidis (strain Emoy2) TaxID=559515 RepID=M4BMS0_HYAAE
MGVAVALCGYYYSKVVTRRRANRLPRSASRCLASAPRHSLRELQPSGQWVALCGTVFDVSGDPFFDASCAGVYSSWVNHEITYLILQLGLVLDAADDAKAIASYLDREWQVEALQGNGETARRERDLLIEWFGRFYKRYQVVAQLSDYYVGGHWDVLRTQLLPLNSGSSSGGGKCPLGFGVKTNNKVMYYTAEDAKKLQTITFQGRRYDVSQTSLFHPDGGQFAHFVGHDVTYALAIQSMRVEDLDVVPARAYTFDEQLVLERYRMFFSRELALIEVDNEQIENEDGKSNVVSVHRLIENSDDMAEEECVQRLEKMLESAGADQVNAVCSRTAMTPLHKAVEKNRFDLVKVLVRAGADIEARAALYDDETPLDMAYRFCFNDIAAHLEAIATSGN